MGRTSPSRRFLVLVGLALSAQAFAGTVLFSDIGPGYPSDATIGYGPGVAFSGITFTATASGSLAQIVSEFSSNTPFNLTADLYTNSGDAPGTLLESYSITVGFSDTVTTTINSVVDPTLTAGTQYWFVLVDPNSMDWAGNDESVLGGFWVGPTLTSLVQDYAGDDAPGIELIATPGGVPEPSAAILVAIGGLALMGLRRARIV
jgi:hypothetical protein